MKLGDLGTFKADTVRAGHERRFRGVLAGDFDPEAIISPFWFWWCFCVQDSPENPCPCTNPPFVVWVIDQPTAISRLGRKTTEGHELHEITLDSRCRVTVDVPVPLTARELAAAGGAALTGCSCDANGEGAELADRLRATLIGTRVG